MAFTVPDAEPLRYSVIRSFEEPGRVRVALVCESPSGRHEPTSAPSREMVLAERSFALRSELFDLESYAVQLQRAAEHGNRGTLGCFVRIEPVSDATVRVTLCERWFNGKHLLCEQLAVR